MVDTGLCLSSLVFLGENQSNISSYVVSFQFIILFLIIQKEYKCIQKEELQDVLPYQEQI